jgi:hypothetical protein
MSNLQKTVTIVLAVLAIGAIVYLIMSYNSGSTMPMNTRMSPMSTGMSPMSTGMSPMMMGVEHFESTGSPADATTVGSGSMSTYAMGNGSGVDASESIEMIAQPQSLMQSGSGTQMNNLPSECYPKDVLSSADLLPRDANSLWAQVSPSGQGSLADQNFLTSGFHIGINTVGQTLRNANRQLRSEPLNPQVKVSPWQQTTIEPDINRRPLEIEGNL